MRDSLRGLGTGVKRSLDDADGKSYARAKTRERFTQAAQVTNDTTKRFVAAKTVHAEEKTSHSKDTDDVISLGEEAKCNNDSTQSSKADKEETVDMFSEWQSFLKSLTIGPITDSCGTEQEDSSCYDF